MLPLLAQTPPPTTVFDDSMNKGSKNFEAVLPIVLQLVWWSAVMLAVVFIAYGGFKYTTSNGDSSKINEAKSSILNGVIGLVVVLSIAVIFRFILGVI